VDSIINLVRPNLRELKTYVSARSLNKKGSVYLDANELPWDSLGGKYNRYPSPQPKKVTQQLASFYKVDESQLSLLRGSDEAIDNLIRTFCEPGRGGILTCPPTYGMYDISAKVQGVVNIEVPLVTKNNQHFQLDMDGIINNLSSKEGEQVHLVFLCSPNNPTGNLLNKNDILQLCEQLYGKALVVVDEAYVEFSSDASLTSYIETSSNLVVLRTLSKAHGLAGVRAGVAIAQKNIISCLDKVRAPYPIAQPVINVLTDYFAGGGFKKLSQNIENLISEKERVSISLSKMSIVRKVFASDANYLLVEFLDSHSIIKSLESQGIIIRDRSSMYNLENCIRISIGTEEENNLLLKALED
jgi:histidinol-phosphate aminotransferase